MPRRFATLEGLNSLADIAVRAGEAIMPYYKEIVTHRIKDDASPVTDADIAANTIIVDALRALFPEIPVVSEEDAESFAKAVVGPFFLVDPLDGTRGFIKGSGEFTVNIGLIENGFPTAGVIYVPVARDLYCGAENLGASHNGESIRTRTAPEDGLDVVKSSMHASKSTDEYLANVKVRAAKAASSSLKFCTVAEGNADLYPRFGPTSEWDTAAGQAIVEAAGGRVETLDGKRLGYGKADFRNPNFIVFGR